jgi:hypothetical protein
VFTTKIANGSGRTGCSACWPGSGLPPVTLDGLRHGAATLALPPDRYEGGAGSARPSTVVIAAGISALYGRCGKTAEREPIFSRIAVGNRCRDAPWVRAVAAWSCHSPRPSCGSSRVHDH